MHVHSYVWYNHQASWALVKDRCNFDGHATRVKSFLREAHFNTQANSAKEGYIGNLTLYEQRPKSD